MDYTSVRDDNPAGGGDLFVVWSQALALTPNSASTVWSSLNRLFTQVQCKPTKAPTARAHPQSLCPLTRDYEPLL